MLSAGRLVELLDSLPLLSPPPLPPPLSVVVVLVVAAGDAATSAPACWMYALPLGASTSRSPVRTSRAGPDATPSPASPPPLSPSPPPPPPPTVLVRLVLVAGLAQNIGAALAHPDPLTLWEKRTLQLCPLILWILLLEKLLELATAVAVLLVLLAVAFLLRKHALDLIELGD
eukprot:scaffold7742_cov59-Phaeocystis_antarctica.AAC.2